jgi:hypothetical protein
MRWTALCLTAMCASVTAAAMPPYANELMLPAGGLPTDTLPKASRGQFLGVACANVEQVASSAIRVVLYFAAGEAPGYRGVLATDMVVSSGAVHVRVPNTPDIADHTMFVRVYFVDAAGRHTCDAGKVRIV